MSAKASGSDAKANGSTTNRAHHDGSSGRAFTTEQKAAVIRVRRCGATAFYDILDLETEKTTVTDAGIKKAYRKLSLLTHPDKNGYDGADEAFKMVSRAFQILSDPDKKRKYDQFGGDPDSRFGGGSASSAAAGASPFSNFARASPGFGGSPFGGGRGRPMFEEEITPEELFRQFFGGGFGGGGGGMFDGSPGFVFNMGGGPGIRVHQFGGGRPRARPPGTNAREEPPNAMAALMNLLPLLVLFIIPILTSLFSFGGSYNSTPNFPAFNFDTPKPPMTELRTSTKMGIKYFVNPVDVTDYGTQKWKELDRYAEHRLAYTLKVECLREESIRDDMMRDAQGWFFVDQDKWDRAQNMEMNACKRMQLMGLTGR